MRSANIAFITRVTVPGWEGHIWPVGREFFTVNVCPSLRGHKAAFVAAHELGHTFWYDENLLNGQARHDQSQEAWCDMFATLLMGHRKNGGRWNDFIDSTIEYDVYRV